MATTALMTEQEYRELALSDPEHRWELWDGVPREKPLMSMRHNRVAFFVGHLLQLQLDRREYIVNVNGDRARISPRAYFIPDVVVIPASYQELDDPRTLGAYSEPLPLVVEIWSPSTGRYDIERKLDGYRERGDREIWYFNPYDRTLIAWRRQADGGYVETTYRGGMVQAESLPGVSIDLDTLIQG